MGNNGIDSLGITPSTRNVSANITSMSSFIYDGGNGSDNFKLYNDVSPDPWTYTRFASALQMVRLISPPYFANFQQVSVESIVATGGTQNDYFYAAAVPSGTSVEFRGNAGIDTLAAGSTGLLDEIRGPIMYQAGVNGGVIELSDTPDETGDTFHLDQTSLGAYAGDNLFGPGGSIQFSGLTNYNSSPGINMYLGDGADTIYAQPLPTARVSINARSPTTLPGDKLTLALAQAQNPIVTGTSTGSVTSTNLQTLDWTGIETLAAPDATTPTVDIVDVTPDPRATNVDSIAINFSEAVSNFTLAQLALTIGGGADLLPASATLTSGDQIHWTLGNLAGLTSFSGSYLLTLTAGTGIADVAGNPLLVGATDGWTTDIMPGDANGDGAVDIFDINLVSSNWGTTGPAGDVNIDGIVDIFDINLISSNWSTGGGGGSGADTGRADDSSSPAGAGIATTPRQAAQSASNPSSPDALALRLASTPAETALPGDLNHDGRVDIFDVNFWSSHYDQSPNWQRKPRPALANLETIKAHGGRRARAVDALFATGDFADRDDSDLAS